jgi:N-terminal half of MaoC dehydratase
MAEAARIGKPFRMAVELGKIREFAAATRSTNPAHRGEPGDTPVSPPTFLMSATLWQEAESSPWHGVQRNYDRILHGEQEFVFHEPPPWAGTVLTGQSRIERVYEKTGKRGGRMTFTDVVTEFRDDTGKLVAETRSTSIETSQATGAEE